MTDRRPPCRKCGSQDQMWVAEMLVANDTWNRWICRRCGYDGSYFETERRGVVAYDELAERYIEYHEDRS